MTDSEHLTTNGNFRDKPSPISDERLLEAGAYIGQLVDVEFRLLHAPVTGKYVGFERPFVKIGIGDNGKLPRRIYREEVVDIQPHLPQE